MGKLWSDSVVKPRQSTPSCSSGHYLGDPGGSKIREEVFEPRNSLLYLGTSPSVYSLAGKRTMLMTLPLTLFALLLGSTLAAQEPATNSGVAASGKDDCAVSGVVLKQGSNEPLKSAR